MNAREIDALVAEHVMGNAVCKCDPSRKSPRFNPDDGKCLTCGNSAGGSYSTDPIASKMLRDKMRADGWYVRMESTPRGKSNAAVWKSGQVFTGRADTEEMSVALAALEAVGKPVQA